MVGLPEGQQSAKIRLLACRFDTTHERDKQTDNHRTTA